MKKIRPVDGSCIRCGTAGNVNWMDDGTIFLNCGWCGYVVVFKPSVLDRPQPKTLLLEHDSPPMQSMEDFLYPEIGIVIERTGP